MTDVAQSGIGITEEQIHEWRSGKSQPATFKELEPLIAYLQVAAAATACTRKARHGKRVTGWTAARWRRLWKEAAAEDSSMD